MRRKTSPNSFQPEVTSAIQQQIQQKSDSKTTTRTLQKPEDDIIGNEHFGAKAGAMMDNVMGAIAKNPPATQPLTIQPQLTIGAPQDKYEREADRVSKDTVQRLHSHSQPNPMSEESEGESVRLKPRAFDVQRDGGEPQTNASPELEQSISSAKSGGMELPDRDRYESAMGANFSKVKVHTGGESDRLNRSLSSRAFTNQNHIFFKQGEFNPGTRQGDGLISHELTHVMQQDPGVISRTSDNRVERSPSNQISRAPEGWIQRDVVGDFDKAFNIGKENDITKLKISKFKKAFGKTSETFKIIRELLQGYEKIKDKPDSYLYLEKAYNLLVIKQQRNEAKPKNKDAQQIVNHIKFFRTHGGFDAKVKQASEDYQQYVQLQKQGKNEPKQEEEPKKKKSSRAKIKDLVDKHKDPDLPPTSEDQEKEASTLSGKYRDLVDSKVKVGFSLYQKVGKIDTKQLSDIANQFRGMSKKDGGWGYRQRGKILTEIDYTLTRMERASNKGDEREAYEYAIGAVSLLDVWLLKYQPQVSKYMKLDLDGTIAQDQEIDKKKDSYLVQAYKNIHWFRQSLAEVAGEKARQFNIQGLARPGQTMGKRKVSDEMTLQKLRQEQVLKKVGKKYNGECGYFFKYVYPFILDGIAPTVGNKGKIELDVNFPGDPFGTTYAGFNFKIDAERKDEKEFKVYNHLQFQIGGKAGYETDDGSFGAKAEGKVGGGMMLEAVGHTSQKVGQLISYGLYRRFRESKLVPSKVTNFLWGGGKITSAGYADAEAWATSVEEQTWGYEANADLAKKAYIETAYMASAKGKAGLTFAKDEIGVEGTAEFAMGKRYSKESLEGTGALKDGYSTDKQDKKKFLGVGWGYKSKGMDTARIVLEGKVAGVYNGVGMSIGLKPKYEFLADAGKEGGLLGLGNLALRKAEYEIKIGATGMTEGSKFLQGLTVAAASGSTLLTAITNLNSKAKATADKKARKKDSLSGNVSNAIGKVGNTTVIALAALGAFGDSESTNAFEMEAGGQSRTKLTWEFPNVQTRLKEKQGLKDKIGTLEDEIALHKQFVRQLEQRSMGLQDPEAAKALSATLTEQDQKIIRKRKERAKLKAKLFQFENQMVHELNDVYAKTKAKGESHLEALAKMKLSIGDLSSMKYELARRLVSFKWEAEGQKWAISSGDDIIRGKKRREVLGFDLRREDDK